MSLKTLILIIGILSSFINPFMVSSLNLALPAIGKEFSSDAVLLSWIATSYLLAAAITLLPGGKIGDIYGRKKVYIIGMIVFTISSLLCAFTGSTFELIIARIVQGVGSALIMTNGLAIVTSVFPAQERGKALGILVASVYVGLSTGPLVGGFLTHHFTWRSIFLIVVPLGIAVVLLYWLKVKEEWKDAEGEGFDYIGTALYCLALITLMVGVTLLPLFIGFFLIFAGVAGLAAFIKWESRIEFPVLDVSLILKNKTFAFSNLAALINYSATFAVVFLLSLYLQYIKGYTAQIAGLILIAQPVIQAVFSPFTGRLSDKIEPRLIASAGMVLTTAGLFMLIFLSSETSILFIIGALVALGCGFGLFSSPNINAIMGSVEKKHYGVASGTTGTTRVLGQMFSMGVATLIFAIIIGRAEITPDVYPEFLQSTNVAFIIFTILCAGGIFASAYRGKMNSTHS
jgi:EmrB/QacA subfamily drug resistance transporter